MRLLHIPSCEVYEGDNQVWVRYVGQGPRVARFDRDGDDLVYVDTAVMGDTYQEADLPLDKVPHGVKFLLERMGYDLYRVADDGEDDEDGGEVAAFQ